MKNWPGTSNEGAGLFFCTRYYEESGNPLLPPIIPALGTSPTSAETGTGPKARVCRAAKAERGAAIVHVPALMVADRMWPFLLALLLGAAPTTGWRVPDPDRLLVIDTNRGRIVIEMEPRVAPQAVERVALLARRGTYDGLLFHRVIEKFVAQTGNPNNRDGGGTELPDLKREVWISKPASEAITWVRVTNDGREGMIGSLPVAKGADPVMPAWVPQCAGIVGMGRQADPNSANSEIYITLGSARGLDHDYTLFGRVLAGQSVVDALAVGEPPANPDRMIRVRSAVELPAADRPRLEVMDATSREYARFAAAKRRALGTQLSICDMLPPVRSSTSPKRLAAGRRRES